MAAVRSSSTPLFLLEDEWAVEIANQTVHDVLHVGRVPDESGGFRAQMAIYVKPNGLLRTAYMAAIRPFRYLIVYPAMMRDLNQLVQADAGNPADVGDARRSA